ncbi:MAG: peptidoglycan-binding domain-containing protein [bacterium]|nr:peptidoglycan-binding domain-containing protein [bacterium]
MKKTIIAIILLLMPVFTYASIDQNLYYGLRNNEEVKELQQYLIGNGFLSGQATGNFFSLTLSAVKKYQKSIKLNGTGYVGVLTRQAINANLLSNQSVSTTSNPAPNQISVVIPLTGSLNLSQKTSFSNQSVTAPQSKLKLSEFSLINNTTEAINLKTIQVDLATDSDLYITNLYVKNLYVTYGSNKTMVLNTIAHSNYWQIDFQLPAGQTIDLSVYGDVNSSIPLNSVINSSLLVTGVTALSNTAVNTNSNVVLPGQNVTFSTGSLTVSLDSSTPISRMVAINQRVVAGKFKFTATNDSYTISELKFIVPDPNVIPTITGAVLSDTVTQVLLTPKPISVAYNGKDYVFNFNVNIPIPTNSSKSLTFYYDLNNNIYSNNTNINIAPVLAYVKAVNSRGETIDGVATDYSNNISAYHGGIVLPSNGVKVNDMYFFKSIPIFTAISSNTTVLNGSNVNLYTFNITADPNGDVSVKQIMFTIVITDPNNTYPNLNNFTLFKGNTDYTSSAAIGKTVNNNYYISLRGDNGIGIGTNTVVVTFDREETIPAGKTQIYILKARVNNLVTSSILGSNSISTYIPSDASRSNNGRCLRMVFTNIYGLSRNQNDMSVINYNLLWSDKSAFLFSHNDLNGFSTNDWYNGFNVLNLPLSTQTIAAK